MLVIVHGLGRHAREWKEWAGDDVLVPDLAELRRTDAKPVFTHAIDLVRSQLHDRGIARATWLGQSGGAHLALEVAARYPESVERLILVAAVPSRQILAQVRCPILVVLGALDDLRIGASPQVSVEVIANAAHDPHLETRSASRLDRALDHLSM